MFLAGLKKEIMLFTRGFRMWGIVLMTVGMAGSYPLLYKFMENMLGQMNEMGEEIGGEFQEMAGSMNGMINGMSQMYGGSLAQIGFYGGIAAIVGFGFLIMALFLMPTAGGEQKKRTVIIPNCAGLTPTGYILPKYAFYPALMGIIAFISALTDYALCHALFETDIPFNDVLYSGIAVSVYVVFMTSVYFLCGVATGKPGISVIIVYLGSMLIPEILNMFDISKYNPFALSNLAMQQAKDMDMNNFVLSVVVSIVMSVICCLLALMTSTLKKIDNAQGEANL